MTFSEAEKQKNDQNEQVISTIKLSEKVSTVQLWSWLTSRKSFAAHVSAPLLYASAPRYTLESIFWESEHYSYLIVTLFLLSCDGFFMPQHLQTE